MATRTSRPIWDVQWDETVVGAIPSLAALRSGGVPAIALVHDTGLFADDAVTNDARLQVDPVSYDVKRTFSVNGSAPVVDFIQPTFSGAYTVVIEDARPTGTTTNNIAFVLDVDQPLPPVVSLINDTGISRLDHVTKDDRLMVSGAEDGALVEYTLDGGTIWSSTLPSVFADRTYDIGVRQTDVAGNVSDIGPFTFTIDTISPDRPSVELNRDTDNPGDLVTSDEALVVRGVEAGGTVEYSSNGGQSWSGNAPSNLPNGIYTVTVRQVDPAGNQSQLVQFTFTVLKSIDPIDPTGPPDSIGPSNPGSNNGHAGAPSSDGPDLGGVDFGGVDFGGCSGLF